MKVVVDTNANINGTLVLPVWQDSKGMVSGTEAGVHRSLKNQIEVVLGDGDFKAKSGVSVIKAFKHLEDSIASI